MSVQMATEVLLAKMLGKVGDVHTPSPTGAIPTFSANSKFDPTLGPVTAGVPRRSYIVPLAATGDKEQFNGSKDVGRTQSATAAFARKYSGH